MAHTASNIHSSTGYSFYKAAAQAAEAAVRQSPIAELEVSTGTHIPSAVSVGFETGCIAAEVIRSQDVSIGAVWAFAPGMRLGCKSDATKRSCHCMTADCTVSATILEDDSVNVREQTVVDCMLVVWPLELLAGVLGDPGILLRGGRTKAVPASLEDVVAAHL